MANVVKNISLLVGNVVKLTRIGLDGHACARVRVRRNEFDEYLKMYWPAFQDFWSHDSGRISRLGDLVLIAEMKEPLAAKVTHEIRKVVHKHGHVINPLTNRRVIRDNFFDRCQYRDNLIKKLLTERGITAKTATHEKV